MRFANKEEIELAEVMFNHCKEPNWYLTVNFMTPNIQPFEMHQIMDKTFCNSLSEVIGKHYRKRRSYPDFILQPEFGSNKSKGNQIALPHMHGIGTVIKPKYQSLLKMRLQGEFWSEVTKFRRSKNMKLRGLSYPSILITQYDNSRDGRGYAQKEKCRGFSNDECLVYVFGKKK